ncbi:SDR family oxidoreductase [Streptomyces sp. JB150]|nr:SDR family oxidoreductase [Streptomyces sp. JB150]
MRPPLGALRHRRQALRRVADTLGPRHRYVTADVTDAQTPGRLVTEATHHHGRVDVRVNNAAYSATKAGVLALSEALGREARPHGVHVSAVLPVLVGTPLALASACPAVSRPDRRPPSPTRFSTSSNTCRHAGTSPWVRRLPMPDSRLTPWSLPPAQARVMFCACGPFWPCPMSKVTCSPSVSSR